MTTKRVHNRHVLLKMLAIMGACASMPACALAAVGVSADSAVSHSWWKSFRENVCLNLHTNIILDAALLPNIGAELWLGKQWSVAASGVYASWRSRSRHRYLYLNGFDITARHWFGKRAKEKPLTGHHAGIYVGTYRFDIEDGGEGYMGGPPQYPFWQRRMYNVGMEYGYSLPLAKRLNMDFTIGFGYFGGKFIKYDPVDMCYVWKSTNSISWWGPNKAEISLVWLLGGRNFNRRKGGRL